MAQISDEQLEKIKAANPGVEAYRLRADPWDEDIVVRVPSEPTWMQWQANRAEPETRRGAMKDLINQSLLFPSTIEVAAIFDRRPALVEEFAAGIQKVAGVIQSVQLKKL